jgi:GTP-binding protein
MRREGFELLCSNPRVLFKTIDGVKHEPIERVTIDVPSDYVGSVVEKLGNRKGDLVEMTPVGTRMRIIYTIPSRCLFGYRSQFLTDTRGEGIINSIFEGYEPFRGEVSMRPTGCLVASEAGETTRYGLYNSQERGRMFVGPQTPVYEGMIVGENPKNDDIALNPCKTKQLTAIRSAGADEKLILTPPVVFSLEEAIEFIKDDELIEVTPKTIRLRKKILNTELRMKEMMRIRRAIEANK